MGYDYDDIYDPDATVDDYDVTCPRCGHKMDLGRWHDEKLGFQCQNCGVYLDIADTDEDEDEVNDYALLLGI